MDYVEFLLMLCSLPLLFGMAATKVVTRRLVTDVDGDVRDRGESSVTITDPGDHNVYVEVDNGQTDKEVAIVFTHTRVKYYELLSDRDVTIETNAVDASGGDTIVLKAGAWVIWDEKDPHTKLFTAAVTKWYVTNASGAAALIIGRVIEDATP